MVTQMALWTQHKESFTPVCKMHCTTSCGLLSCLSVSADCYASDLIPKVFQLYVYCYLQPVLWRCWLGGRKGIRPVKNWAVGCWHGYLSGVRCRLAYGPADATATHCLVLSFWYRLTPGSPGQKAIKLVCVCVCVVIIIAFDIFGYSCARLPFKRTVL